MNKSLFRGLALDRSAGLVSVSGVAIASGAAALALLRERDCDDPLVQTHRYWQGLAADDGVHSKSGFNPAAIASPAVSYILLIDVVTGATRRFRYRLVGTEVEYVFGDDYTGRFMDEIVPRGLYEKVSEAYEAVCDTRAPVLFSGAYVRSSGEIFDVSRILLPLETVPGTVDCILSAITRDDVAR